MKGNFQLVIIIWFRLFFFTLSTNGWLITRWGRWRRTTTTRLCDVTLSVSGGESYFPEKILPAFDYSSEVVGAFGRMGSFWLCHQEEDKNEISSVVAVPRGLSPGCLTKPGRPIFVATPSTSWPSIWEQTLHDRREDLIFVGNGIPPDDFQDATIVVPHYSILSRCSRNKNDDSENNPIGTSSQSPKTFLRGKHSDYTAAILNRFDVSTEVVKSFTEIRIKAALKLVWASCMWLICHSATSTSDNNGNPINFETVHKLHQETIDQLVQELVPALERFVGQSVNIHDVNDYVKSYSLSIPDAIPSKELALAELEDRNGLWLGLRTDDFPQLLHQELIEKVAGKAALDDLLEKSCAEEQPSEIQHDDAFENNILKLKEIGLEFSGTTTTTYSSPHQKALKRVVIVGGGILGSSVAYFLAQRLVPAGAADICVLDLLASENDLGRTTPASWAWLNANGKRPKQYQMLNQLGLYAWKACALISDLPSWTGSLVRFENNSDDFFVHEGGYPSEGPLSLSRILELEPLASWELKKSKDADGEGYTYFFPNEGFIDPSDAVKIFREEAKKLGVKFVSNRNVTNILRDDDETGSVCGVETTSLTNTTDCGDYNLSSDATTTSTSIIPADLVIVAAGVGAAAKCLGGLPLLHKPGQISYAKPIDDDDNDNNTPRHRRRRLSRILVDPSRSSHVLQRPDGTIVAGGGTLETGGASLIVSPTTTTDDGTTTPDDDNNDQRGATILTAAHHLLEAAKELSPTVLNQSEFSHTCQAVRPMPRDGLPAVGYLQQGLYTIVTHSGMTLGPLLSAMSAGEIAEHISCDLLNSFRPTRFFQKEDTSTD